MVFEATFKVVFLTPGIFPVIKGYSGISMTTAEHDQCSTECLNKPQQSEKCVLNHL